MKTLFSAVLKVLIIAICVLIQKPAFSDSIPICTDFETPPFTHIVLDTSHHVWQIGTPHKSYLDSAYSPNHCIITDTLNPYPLNSSDDFMLSYETESYPVKEYCVTKLTFLQKFDIDSNSEGFIEFKCMSMPWMDINHDTFYYLHPDSVYHIHLDLDSFYITDNLKIKGNSGGWIRSVYWLRFPISLLIGAHWMYYRFTLASGMDTVANDGWMIDDICFLYYYDNGNYAKLNETKQARLFPNPVNDQSVIHLNAPAKEATLILSDIHGKEIEKWKFSNTDMMPFKSFGLSPGMYI